jgi:response regulator of citrate/malate metabolism
MLKVLIAEDDLLIAGMAEEVVAEGGFMVCGIARTVSDAVALGRLHKPDLALLDVRLDDGGLGTDIAAQLAAFGRIGVLYATGNSANVLENTCEGDACIVKPYGATDLVRALQIVAEIVATGTASPPFPRGFDLLPQATIVRRVSQR